MRGVRGWGVCSEGHRGGPVRPSERLTEGLFTAALKDEVRAGLGKSASRRVPRPAATDIAVLERLSTPSTYRRGAREAEEWLTAQVKRSWHRRSSVDVVRFHSRISLDASSRELRTLGPLQSP